jgi:hypothetical protein
LAALPALPPLATREPDLNLVTKTEELRGSPFKQG